MTTSQGAAVIYQVFVRQYGPTGTFDDVIVDMARIRDVAGDGAYIHILPCHPTGLLFRKGSLGSPYSIRSYKQLDPAIVGATVRANTNTGSTLPASSASSTVSTSASAAAVTPEVSGSVSSAKCTTSADGVGKFRELVECAHSKGLKIMMDVVFAHTSRDSDVVVHHPEWFYLSGGIPAPRVAEWSDVASFDWEAGGEALRAYLIDVLMYWADMGVDGFRCDVAPDIPLDFWERARKTVATKTPNMLWLGETWTLAGVEKKRRRDCPMYPADSEMCRAFDLLYDYDLYQLWRACVAGEAPVWRYFEGIRLQSATLPPGKHKIRFVETHDKDRMASLVKSKDKLLAWTAFAAFLPGPFLVYAGQESAAIKKPSLFDRDPVVWGQYSLQPFIKSLTNLKRSSAQSGLFTIVSESDPVIAVWSNLRIGGTSIVGVFNIDNSPAGKKIHLPDCIPNGKHRQLLCMPKSSPEIVLVTNGTMNTPQSAVVFECHMDSHPYWFPSPYFETISRRSCLRSQPEVPPPSTFLSNESQIALPMKTGGNSVQPGNFWWEKTVIYEIYPKSFCEHHEVASSSHVGCGNINGIRHKLSTLHSLGIETLWLCPVFASPYLDGGYDVSDYKSINPLFGTLEDMENLIAELHQKKMRLILDLVLNHTSTEHQWFKDSRLKRNGHDDWYIWKKGLPNRPPNNWVSVAGGPAWTFDKERGEWYMHTFATFQPDLNYRHPAVKEAIIEQVSFWIKKGVDGFRLDALKHIFKDAFLQDEPINPENPPNGQPFLYKHLNHLHTTNLPEVHEFLQTLRQHVGEEICLMGECWQDWDSVIPYFGQPTQRECHLMLHFGLIGMNNISGQKLIHLVETSEKYKDVTPVWAIGSHDVDRAWSRFGPQKASLATLVLLTLRGVPIIYYGDEIGLKNYQPPTNSSSPALPDARYAFRTPMQFDTSPNSGFTKAPRPWIPLGPDWKTSNVESQTGRMDSTLELHRALIQLRNTHPCLHMGQCKILSTGKGGKTVAYSRIHGTDKITVIINSSASPTTVPLAPLLFPQSHSSASATTTEHVPQVHVLLSSRCVHPKPITLNSPSISLGPWEGIVLTADSVDVSNDSAAPQTAVTTNNTKTKPTIHSNTAPPPTKSHTTTASTTTTTSSKKATAKEDNVHGEPPSSEGVPKPSGFTIEEPHKRKHKKKT